MTQTKRFGFNSLPSLVDMLREIQDECLVHAHLWPHNAEFRERWTEAANAMTIARYAIQHRHIPTSITNLADPGLT